MHIERSRLWVAVAVGTAVLTLGGVTAGGPAGATADQTPQRGDLLVVEHRSDGSTVRTLEPDGTTYFRHDMARGAAATWTPDGRVLVLADSRLQLLDPRSEGVTALDEGPHLRDAVATWIADADAGPLLAAPRPDPTTGVELTRYAWHDGELAQLWSRQLRPADLRGCGVDAAIPRIVEPVGDRIAVAVDTAGCHHDVTALYILGLTDGAVQLIHDAGAPAEDPALGPNGRNLDYWSPQGGRRVDVRTGAVASHTRGRVHAVAGDRSLTVSEDGRRLLSRGARERGGDFDPPRGSVRWIAPDGTGGGWVTLETDYIEADGELPTYRSVIRRYGADGTRDETEVAATDPEQALIGSVEVYAP